MKILLLFLCWLLVLDCFAQNEKTTSLKSITVYGLSEEKYLVGSSMQPLDSSLKAHERSHHLGEILSFQFPIYFRTYGNGMLSGISMRGTSPQHTSVLWNGININSFSLGQADFSILPAVAFDEVKVHEGAGSARFGSGAFGGSIILNSNSLSNKNSFSFTQDAGSFGRYFSSINGSFAVERWSFKTNVYNLISKNNFPILSTGQREQNAAIRQSGILQDIQYKWSDAKILSLHFWYHNADRQIQPTIGQLNSTDNQQDRNQRLSVQYRSLSRLGLLSLHLGYINDLIVYDGGPSRVIREIVGARHEFIFAKTFHGQVGAEWNHIVGNIPNYPNGHAQEDRYDFTSSIQKNFSERTSVVVNLRQPVVSGFNAPFLPYLGVDYFAVKKNESELKLYGSISKNYRVPTLNDRYWVGSGDKNLLPETSLAGEFGIAYRLKSVALQTTYFAQRVDEWIQWVPKQNGVYRPQNSKQVLAEGVEVKVSARQQIGAVMIVPMLTFQYTKSITTQAPTAQQFIIGKQLIYTPQYTSSGYAQVIWKKFSSDISAQYNGKRFTESSNSNTYALPAFVLINFSMGTYWTINNHRFDLRASVKNLFNIDYQLYASRAMPGRNYDLQFTYQLNSKSNNL